MEDENRKKRKTAKKERVEEVCALVRFVKARDRRIKKHKEMAKREQAEREIEKRKQAEERKKDIAAAREVGFVLSTLNLMSLLYVACFSRESGFFLC